MSNSKLISATIPAHSNNYYKGRDGSKISEITMHHTAAAKVSAARIGQEFQKSYRESSSNYGIGYEGEIALYVDESNTSYANSNWDANCRAVTIECANSTGSPNWEISDATMQSLIKLVADIAIRNNLGTLVRGKNFTWHQMYAQTACPGPYLLGKIDYIIEEANKIINPLVITAIPAKKVELVRDTNLWDLTFTDINKAKSVKSLKAGTLVDVVAIANHNCGSNYYMTQYSYSSGINNGINVLDCKDYVEPTIEAPQVEEPSDITEIEPERPVDADLFETKGMLAKLLDLIIKLLRVMFNN